MRAFGPNNRRRAGNGHVVFAHVHAVRADRQRQVHTIVHHEARAEIARQLAQAPSHRQRLACGHFFLSKLHEARAGEQRGLRHREMTAAQARHVARDNAQLAPRARTVETRSEDLGHKWEPEPLPRQSIGGRAEACQGKQKRQQKPRRETDGLA